MNSIISTLRLELKQSGNEQLQKSSQHFFKESVQCYGIKSAVVDRISKEYFKTMKDASKTEIFNFCDQLWQSGLLEEAIIACNLSYFVHKDYEPGDLKVFEKWIGSYVSNWATCDTLCNHTVGEFLEMYPQYIAGLKRWAGSSNRWMRRASAVSLIVPARRGKFLGDITEIADLLLFDGDDLVQKGYGWMLKAASQPHQVAVFDYVMKNKQSMPRTALRYAIEKMPAELKVQAMLKETIGHQ